MMKRKKFYLSPLLSSLAMVLYLLCSASQAEPSIQETAKFIADNIGYHSTADSEEILANCEAITVNSRISAKETYIWRLPTREISIYDNSMGQSFQCISGDCMQLNYINTKNPKISGPSKEHIMVFYTKVEVARVKAALNHLQKTCGGPAKTPF